MSEDDITQFYWRVNVEVKNAEHGNSVEAVEDDDGRVDYADANEAAAFAVNHPHSFVSFYRRIMQGDRVGESRWLFDMTPDGRVLGVHGVDDEHIK